jgi:ribosomal protein S18 acetylase RimI-like enzyme
VKTDSKDASGITTRPCNDSDEAFLFSLFKSVKGDELAALNWPPAQLEPLLRMQFTAQSQSYAADYPRAAHELVCFNGQPVGRLITDNTAEAMLLVDIALTPEVRGRGIGAELIRGLQAQCAADRKPLRLHVANTNRAVHLYERLGFVVTGETEVRGLMEWKPQS